ncbi:MAG TPA: NYN domain-containing protein [Clostridia bacterium]|jgi:uncharacterized LabA/DUF88 family protein|nr:NYN domain-containing protein [Clostridia bacterium]
MEDNKIAILIDAENISYKNVGQIIDTMEKKGTVYVKEIVSDWTRITGAKMAQYNRAVQIEGWRKEASKYSLTGVQSFSHVSGKNTSDIALTIEAMKILYEKPFINTFCIVSNDSDFTRLAQELKAHGKEVIGMGERKAIKEFINAFSEFIYLGESIDESTEKESIEKTSGASEDLKVKEKELQKTKGKVKKPVLPTEQMEALKVIIEDAMDENGVALYSLIASKMKKQFSDFVPENYNVKNISALMKLLLPYLPQYQEHKESIPNNPNGYIMMLKKKEEKRTKNKGSKK